MTKIELTLLATAFLTVSQLQAQTPSSLRDLVGARASSGERVMADRGYRLISTQTGDDRKWTNWWNARDRICVSVATVNGRYDSITTTPAPDCNQRPDRPDYADDRPNRPDYDYDRPSRPPMQGGDDMDGRPVDLGLVCYGDGARPALATRYGWQWNERRDRYDYGNRTELTREDFDATVMIQLWGNDGRIKLPGKLIPPIHSRGEGGWWHLDDVYVTSDEIRGTYRLNGLNKPRLTINRRSGRITINGTSSYSFRGNCDSIDKDHQRF